ncbi:unnamed protein product, partial [Polarella glacialis]
VAVDMWSVGCIFAEILLRKPVFEGKAELHQLGLIFGLTGLPDEETWPRCKDLANWKLAENFRMSTPRWRALFPELEDGGSLSDLGLEMLKSLMECCPAQRSSAAAAHKHPYLCWEAPQPQEPGMMPTFQESNAQGRAATNPAAIAVRRGGLGKVQIGFQMAMKWFTQGD